MQPLVFTFLAVFGIPLFLVYGLNQAVRLFVEDRILTGCLVMAFCITAEVLLVCQTISAWLTAC